MNNREKINRMVGLAALSAILIVLQLISNYIQFGPVSITLALIPIVIGAILYGANGGLILGLIHGFLVISAPATQGLFMVYNPLYTVIVCLLKSGLAGFLSGWIYKLLKNYNLKLAVALTSISVPIINTGIFTIGCLTVFFPLLTNLSGNTDTISYLFLTFIGYNFIIEFFVNSVLSPTVLYLVKIFNEKHAK